MFSIVCKKNNIDDKTEITNKMDVKSAVVIGSFGSAIMYSAYRAATKKSMNNINAIDNNESKDNN